MRDVDLYSQILRIKSPWQVSDVEVDMRQGEVTVHVEREAPGYDTRPCRWRHLDTCQYRAILRADVLRVNCSEHCVVTISVP